MGWKQTGHATVRKQRGRWVVRVDGIDTATGKHRPRQIGTFPSQRTARSAAASATAVGETRSERDTVGRLVDRWVASRTDVGEATRAQYEWAAGWIRRGLGSLQLGRLDREDVAKWLDSLARGGELSRRSIQIVGCWPDPVGRTTTWWLRRALAERWGRGTSVRVSIG